MLVVLALACAPGAETPADTTPPTGTGATTTSVPGPATDPIWDLEHPPTWSIEIDADDWEQALWDLRVDDDACARQPYLPATVTFLDPTTGQATVIEDVGVRYRGHSALEDPDEYTRVGFKLSFNEFVEGRRFQDLRKVNLMGTEGDYSLMREHLALALARELGIPAPRSVYAHVYVNGAYLGFFPSTEEPDDEPYLEHHFGDDTGHLYKVEGYCGGRGDFAYEGDDPKRYAETYEPRADTTVEDLATDLVPLLACTAEPDDAAFEDCVQGYVDLDEWLLEIALDVVLPDIDGLIGAGQNFMMYRDPARDRFVVYPWDKDLALDDANLADNASLYGVHPAWRDDFVSLLGDRLARVFRATYCERVLEVLDLYDPAVMVPRIEEHRAWMAPYMEADPFIDPERWGWLVDDIVEVVEERHPEVLALATACKP